MSDSQQGTAPPFQRPRPKVESRPYSRPVSGHAPVARPARPVEAARTAPTEELPSVRFPIRDASPHLAPVVDLDLPWVTAYLQADAHASPLRQPEAAPTAQSVVAEPAQPIVPTAPSASIAPISSATTVAEPEDRSVAPRETQQTPPGPDSWLLQDTAIKLSEISTDAFVRSAIRPSPATTVTLPEWSDDDLLVIMSATRGTLERGVSERAAGEARRAAEPFADAEAGHSYGQAVAESLESLATRIRSGALVLLNNGQPVDAASALASTLLAVLAERK